MKPHDENAEAVWQRTLPQIRATRRKRKLRRIAAGAAACYALAVLLTQQSPKAPGVPIVRTEPALPKIETMAVMRLDDDGTIRLEEIACTELGSIEFAFGQTPIVHSEWPYQ